MRSMYENTEAKKTEGDGQNAMDSVVHEERMECKQRRQNEGRKEANFSDGVVNAKGVKIYRRKRNYAVDGSTGKRRDADKEGRKTCAQCVASLKR